MRITLFNAFHETTVVVRPTPSGHLNIRQVKAAFKALCSQDDCKCTKVTRAYGGNRPFYFTQSPKGGELTAF